VEKRNNSILLAYCILPDHVHLLMQLPEDKSNYSYQIREIKRLVTLDMQKELDQKSLKIWQDRFWEHTMGDENDLERHLDYIHFNPVKHGYVDDPLAWPWSSYSETASSDDVPLRRRLEHIEGMEKLHFGE